MLRLSQAFSKSNRPEDGEESDRQVAVLLAAFVVGLRAAVLTTFLSIAATGCVLWLETSGQLPESRIARDPLTYWWAQIAIFLAASGLVWLDLRRIGAAIEDARRSERL